MLQKLSREQFNILEMFAMSEEKIILKDIENFSEINKRVLEELKSYGYIKEGKITNLGMDLLEHYKVKRAVFIAAGIGSRLAPITFNTPKPLVRVHGKRIIDSMIDACLEVGINEIYIVRGYFSEQFDQLLYKYPMIKFLENPEYNKTNNISSSMVARYMLDNCYVFEADLLLKNSKIIKKYHYNSDFLAIKKDSTDDWCFMVKDGVIVEEKYGGTDCWQMVGISYWNGADGKRLSQDIEYVYNTSEGKNCYWEQVPLRYCKEHYNVEVQECLDKDVVEIDTFNELKSIDMIYDI